MIDLKAAFDRHDDEYTEFERIEKPIHPRRDLCAFLMLHELLPTIGGRDIVVAAEHDGIWLDVDCERLAEVITDDQVRDPHRCGVRYDQNVNSLSLFV